MSPHAANSLVHDLVQMAQAMEQLPQVQADLALANRDINGYLATIQRLELKLIERANEIDTLNAKVREAEAARDDAELMFLQADDRTLRAVEFIKAQFGAAGSLIQALEPAKAEVKVESASPPTLPIATIEGSQDSAPLSPTVEPQPVETKENVSSGEGSVPVDPTPTPTNTDEFHGASPAGIAPTAAFESSEPVHVDPSPNEPPAQGESAADPTHTASTEQPVQVVDTTSAESSAMPSDPEPNRYDSMGFVRNEWYAWRERQAGE